MQNMLTKGVVPSGHTCSIMRIGFDKRAVFTGSVDGVGLVADTGEKDIGKKNKAKRETGGLGFFSQAV